MYPTDVVKFSLVVTPLCSNFPRRRGGLIRFLTSIPICIIIFFTHILTVFFPLIFFTHTHLPPKSSSLPIGGFDGLVASRRCPLFTPPSVSSTVQFHRSCKPSDRTSVLVQDILYGIAAAKGTPGQASLQDGPSHSLRK